MAVRQTSSFSRAVDGNQDRPQQPAASQELPPAPQPSGPARGSPPDISQPDRRLTVTFGNSLVFAEGTVLAIPVSGGGPRFCPLDTGALHPRWQPKVSPDIGQRPGGGEKSSLEWRWAQGAGGHFRGEGEQAPLRSESQDAPLRAPEPPCPRLCRASGGDASHEGTPQAGPPSAEPSGCVPVLAGPLPGTRCPSVGPPPLPAPPACRNVPGRLVDDQSGSAALPRETYKWARDKRKKLLLLTRPCAAECFEETVSFILSTNPQLGCCGLYVPVSNDETESHSVVSDCW